MLHKLFILRGDLTKKQSLVIQILGFVFIISIWQILSNSGIISDALLPSPLKVISSYPELHYNDALLRELFYSIKINVLGYLEAIGIALPLGFILALFPFFREMFRRYVDAIRFLPLTALTGLFIAWFGISMGMKVQFLSFGIIVYLLPIVIQRVNETDQVYCDTIYTLGANMWQTIRYVFIPDVLSKVMEDIRIITAVSWTYIIVAELLNKSEGGIGAIAYTSARQGRVDKVFAILLVIVLVGFIQDKLISELIKILFPHKKGNL